MILDELKRRVHSLANKLQAILGYIELEKYSRAFVVTKEAGSELVSLSQLLNGLDVVALPSVASQLDPPVAVLPVAVALKEAVLSEDEERFLRELDKERPDVSVVIPFQQLVSFSHEAKIDGSTIKKPPTSEHNRRKTD
jgi:hypothetical protein